MSLLGNIGATYLHPRRVIRHLLAAGVREDRALVLAMGAGTMAFVAQWPRLVRQADASGEDLQMLLGGSLLGLVFILPLIMYVLAALTHLVARLFGGRGSAYASRIALFWAFAAAMPLMLLDGLVGGFIGSGPASSAVGILWCLAVLVFWMAGLIEAHFSPQSGSRHA
ncbi:YIP1 family protein [Pseudooceanicola sediminis]|uniref:YIP1 family protein n=1 Tax=Pseudooceanicola sediminis TaxID=2211117 RepID=A0A399J582_9RHOB|nr:YIP1 family protein [Pseudooceanicola sediminis]KAA2316983.1 YIP1 family protein [Puniceibacterium sp. HSS470]RII40565.1 YIP1 family protein [Pseudooceanicola sediminis]|tara:strand:- start:1341 stop:1844 length:504 start_codon:yes stop_codon:yes gene_type:complete